MDGSFLFIAVQYCSRIMRFMSMLPLETQQCRKITRLAAGLQLSLLKLQSLKSALLPSILQE